MCSRTRSRWVSRSRRSSSRVARFRRRTSRRSGSASRPRSSSRTDSVATSTSPTTPTSPAWPRCATARRAASGGLTILTTLGTGIGSAVIYNGVLIPNSELGHLQRAKHGKDFEAYAAYSAMEREALSWEQWAAAAAGVLQPRRVPLHARPVHRRRRRLQARGRVPATAEAEHADRSGDPSQQRRASSGRPHSRSTERWATSERANGPACTPGSVRGPKPRGRSSLSATRCRAAPAAYPRTRRAASASSVWPCSGRGLPCGSCHHDPGGLLHRRFTLTATEVAAVCSLWHCLADHSGWVLPTALPCGARTFLGAAVTRSDATVQPTHSRRRV